MFNKNNVIYSNNLLSSLSYDSPSRIATLHANSTNPLTIKVLTVKMHRKWFVSKMNNIGIPAFDWLKGRELEGSYHVQIWGERWELVSVLIMLSYQGCQSTHTDFETVALGLLSIYVPCFFFSRCTSASSQRSLRKLQKREGSSHHEPRFSAVLGARLWYQFYWSIRGDAMERHIKTQHIYFMWPDEEMPQPNESTHLENNILNDFSKGTHLFTCCMSK